MSKQTNQYDKIFRENIESVIPGFIQNILRIEAISSEELPDDVQHTKERKPDVLKKITDNQGNTYVLQIEFQVSDEPKMVYRMAEYYIMLERKYDLAIEQYVVYLGSTKPQMATFLDRKRMKFDFSLISFADLDYHLFLSATQPAEVVLGILADFRGDPPERALEQIIQRLEETAIGDFPLRRYFKQLRVLAQLRNLEENLKDIAMDSIAKFVSLEKDAAYMIGREKEKEVVVGNLLKKLDLTVDQIADIVGVSVDFVKSIKQKQSTDK